MTMRIAYADPPYIGQAKKHYDSEEVDHGALLKELETYDGWALSCSSPSLPEVLMLHAGCTDNGHRIPRIGAWVKPFASFKKNVNPAYAWEPVVFIPARKPMSEETIRDFVSAPITTQRGLAGAKPLAFCYWLFWILGMRPSDEFHDLFLGTGAVTEAWEKWQRRLF